jgi:hypothetical protein
MSLWSKRLSLLLRAGMLALLMLGVVIKPVLGSLCDVHILSDALLAAGHATADGKALHQNDRDHARGAHESLHEDNSGSAYADIVAVIIVPAGPITASPLYPAPAVVWPPAPAAVDLRPPIA